MFDSLSDKLDLVFKKLRGQGVMTEDNIKDALREVRLALLEADVNFKVVKDFIERVRERAIGAQVLQSLSPGQQVIRIVHDELVSLMGGGEDNSLIFPQSLLSRSCWSAFRVLVKRLPAANLLDSSGGNDEDLCWSRPMSTGRRPSSSLQTLGNSCPSRSLIPREDQDPVGICRNALRYASFPVLIRCSSIRRVVITSTIT